MRVRDILLSFDGVLKVDVIPRIQQATITYDETKITPEQMTRALKNAQLEVSSTYQVK